MLQESNGIVECVWLLVKKKSMTSTNEGCHTRKLCNLKIVLLGDSSVGKSSIVTRYVVGKFQRSNATIGAAFMTKNILLNDDKHVNLELWDTAGQERYRSLAPMYYRGTDIAIIVYDVTNPDSLIHAESWIEELKSYIESERQLSLKIVLVGNKIDLVDEYQAPKGIRNGNHDQFCIVSAKSGDGIVELFDGIVNMIPEDMFIESKPNKKDVISINKKPYEMNLSSCNC